MCNVITSLCILYSDFDFQRSVFFLESEQKMVLLLSDSCMECSAGWMKEALGKVF